MSGALAQQGSFSRGLISISALVATLMQALDTTIANVALPSMQGSLSASQEQIAWVLTSYIIASAIATMPTGYLAKRFGMRRVFLVAVAGFTSASMLCGLAGNLEQIVVFRVLQGIFGAALIPLSQTALLDIYPVEKQGSAMAAWGVGVMVGPIIGPLLGGWLTEYYSWRWVFFINAPVGIAAYLGLSAGLPRTKKRSVERMDFYGFAFLSIAIGSMQLMFDRGQSLGWFDSLEVRIEALVAVLSFYLFLAHTFTVERPFVSLSLFRDSNFVGGLVLITVLGLTLFSTFALLPPFLQNLQGYPVITAGMVMAPRGIGTMIGMHFSGLLLRRIDPRIPIGVGFILVALAMSWMSHFTLQVPPWEVVMSGFLQGLGMGLIFVTLSTVTFSTLPSEMRGEATSLYSLMRNVGSSVGIAAVFAYQDYGAKMARSVLVENFNYANPALISYLNLQNGLEGAEALLQLSIELERQAALIGMLGNFHYLALGALLSLPMILLLKPRR